MTSPNFVESSGPGLSPGHDLVVKRDNNIFEVGSREGAYTECAVTLQRVLREKIQVVEQD